MIETAEILMVEDNEDDIAVAMWALNKHNLRDKVAVVRDGQEALDTLRQRSSQPKVLLLDLNMPRVDGRELLRRLRADELTRNLPVVVVSSSLEANDIAECYRLGANSYVCKRYSAANAGEYLVEIIRYWVDLNRVSEPSRTTA
jgi:CheY-like chemotaxis protein